MHVKRLSLVWLALITATYSIILTCICLMAGVRLVKRDVRPSHDVTSDRHTTWRQTATWRDVRPPHDVTSDRHTTWRQTATRRDVRPSRESFNKFNSLHLNTITTQCASVAVSRVTWNSEVIGIITRIVCPWKELRRYHVYVLLALHMHGMMWHVSLEYAKANWRYAIHRTMHISCQLDIYMETMYFPKGNMFFFC